MTRATGRDELTDAAADAAIEQACRILRLPTIREHHARVAEAAARQKAGYKGFLVELLAMECDEREDRRKTRLIREAGFPRPKRLDDFDFTANPLVDPGLIHTLAKGAWIRAGQPLCLIGDSGTGKSHLLIGLGIAAAEAGYRVRYVTAAALVNELVEAADDKHLSRTIARYGRVDLLCLDGASPGWSVRPAVPSTSPAGACLTWHYCGRASRSYTSTGRCITSSSTGGVPISSSGRSSPT